MLTNPFINKSSITLLNYAQRLTLYHHFNVKQHYNILSFHIEATIPNRGIVPVVDISKYNIEIDDFEQFK